MKFSEIKEMCDKRGVGLIEMHGVSRKEFTSGIEKSFLIGNLSDFLDKSGKILFYNYDSDKTYALKDSFYKMFKEAAPIGLKGSTSNWLDKNYDSFLDNFCMQESFKCIMLYSVEKDLAWVDVSFGADDDAIKKLIASIMKIFLSDPESKWCHYRPEIDSKAWIDGQKENKHNSASSHFTPAFGVWVNEMGCCYNPWNFG